MEKKIKVLLTYQKNSAMPLRDSYLELNFQVTHRVGGLDAYADC